MTSGQLEKPGILHFFCHDDGKVETWYPAKRIQWIMDLIWQASKITNYEPPETEASTSFIFQVRRPLYQS